VVEARIAGEIAVAQQTQVLVSEKTKQKLEKETVMIDVVEKEVERKKVRS
jgi:hypothetical protein